MTQIVLTAFFIFMSTICAFAEPTFGPEFTFTNREIINGQTDLYAVNSEQSEKYRDLLAERVLKLCEGCFEEIILSKYETVVRKIVYPDGFYFTIGTDPKVVEVQTTPLTVREIQLHMPRFKKDLFEAASQVGVFPDNRFGGGHIHMGLESSVGDNILLMRNLIVDFANHSELSIGILDNDYFNAPLIATLPSKYQEAFKKIIADVDRRKIRSVRVLAHRINQEVYSWNGNRHYLAEKFHALNLMRIVDRFWDLSERTFEFRSIRAQNSPEEFLILTRLFAGRIAHLKRVKTPIPVEFPNLKLFNEMAQMEAFVTFLGEAGISLSEFANDYNLPLKYKILPFLLRKHPVTVYCQGLF